MAGAPRAHPAPGDIPPRTPLIPSIAILFLLLLPAFARGGVIHDNAVP